MDSVSVVNRSEPPVIVKTRQNDEGKEIKQFHINPSMVQPKSEKSMSFQDNSKPIWSTPDGWKSYMEEHGSKKETGAILRLKGEVIGKVNYDGSTTTLKSSGQTYGNGMSERVGNLQSRNPGANVEIFEKGQGPTNAEVFEIFNGYSFKQYISEQYSSMKQDQVSNDYFEPSQRMIDIREEARRNGYL